ncbi:hypothetical protein BDR04DRAFT_1109038 [Suillus decipiens]|nr:hypothetical protein BDR04DRAFT_1109038 [Suillus decipiens]
MPSKSTGLQLALLWMRLVFSPSPLPNTLPSRTCTSILETKNTLSLLTPKSGLVPLTLMLVVLAVSYTSSLTTLACPVARGLTLLTTTHYSSAFTLYSIPPSPASGLPKPCSLMPTPINMELLEYMVDRLPDSKQRTDLRATRTFVM